MQSRSWPIKSILLRLDGLGQSIPYQTWVREVEATAFFPTRLRILRSLYGRKQGNKLYYIQKVYDD